MAGKYSKISLPTLTPEPDRQYKILEVSNHFNLSEKSTGELGALFIAAVTHLEEIEDKRSLAQLQKEAIEQELLKAMEDEDMTSFKTTSGLLYTQAEPYSVVKDKVAYHEWIKKRKLGKLMQVLWQTTNSMVKDMLLEGEPLPPGIEAFMKTSIRYRRQP